MRANPPGHEHFPESEHVPPFMHLAPFLQLKRGHSLLLLKGTSPGQISQRPLLHSAKEKKYYMQLS